jgi:hypothetical protein
MSTNPFLINQSALSIHLHFHICTPRFSTRVGRRRVDPTFHQLDIA